MALTISRRYPATIKPNVVDVPPTLYQLFPRRGIDSIGFARTTAIENRQTVYKFYVVLNAAPVISTDLLAVGRNYRSLNLSLIHI